LFIFTLATLIPIQASFLVRYSFYNAPYTDDSCTGAWQRLDILNMACSPSNGYGTPYGYIGYNSTTAIYYNCQDSACSNCVAFGNYYSLTCQTSPFPPYHSLYAVTQAIPEIPSGWSIVSTYSSDGCQDADVASITAQDNTCRGGPQDPYAFGVSCTSGNYTIYECSQGGSCDSNFCTAITVQPTNVCQDRTKYSCSGSNLQSCQQDWECSSLGTSYGFATCQNGKCQCRQSFQGSATASDQCYCDTSFGNRVVYDQQGNPNCLASGVCTVGGQDLLYLCASYSQNYNFVECVQGMCQCKSGFSGDATPNDPCQCDKNLSWTQT